MGPLLHLLKWSICIYLQVYFLWLTKDRNDGATAAAEDVLGIDWAFTLQPEN